MNAPVQAPSASVDALRYALADALYVAEGRYGVLQDDARNSCQWGCDSFFAWPCAGEGAAAPLCDRCTCNWVPTLRRIRSAVELLISEEFDACRMAYCVESLRLIDALLAALAAPAVQEAA